MKTNMVDKPVYWGNFQISPHKLTSWPGFIQIQLSMTHMGVRLTIFAHVSSVFLSAKGLWVVFEDGVFRRLTCQSGGKGFLWTERTFSSPRFSNLAEEPESRFLAYQNKTVTLFAPLPSLLVQLYGQ